MDKLFLQMLNMSVTASYAIIIVIIARLFLKKVPKVFSYALWSVVLFRLICPISFESIFSLIPINKNTIPQHIVYQQRPQIQSGLNAIDQTVNNLLPAPTIGESANPLQIWMAVGKAVWIFGIVVLLIYFIVTSVKLYSRVKYARHIKDNVYEMDIIETPFVFGIIRPKIYLPIGLSQNEKPYIIKHEQIHIKRLDYLIKPFAFLVLCVHWFNPLVWVAFFLMGQDMELSCDESVIKQLGSDIKKDYSSSLLALSTGRRIVGGCPLAFGENDTKGRIKNILNYKKPVFLVVVIAVVAVVAVCVGLMSNPKDEDVDLSSPDSISHVGGVDGPAKIYTRPTLDTLFEKLIKSPKNSSNPSDYIAANQKVFDEIVSYGDSALVYCFNIFEQGGQTSLKGHLMMAVCRNILAKDDLALDVTTGQEWYDEYKEYAIHLEKNNGLEFLEKHNFGAYLLLQMLEGKLDNMGQEIRLPDFKYSGDDPVLKLVYDTELSQNSGYRKEGGFLVPAVHLHGSYKQENKLKVFATVYDSIYRLFGKELKSVGGSVIPVAITYVKDENDEYILEKYEQAQDGNLFSPSIEEYCTMPVTGKKIRGLASKIIKHYGDYSDLIKLQNTNLTQHLKTYNQLGVSLVNDYDDTSVPLT
ncbi:MAG: M56 family metallopeptidase [Clostridia bacterium]|nr:M56 family metallopeptidase [Clostridia bacterium]